MIRLYLLSNNEVNEAIGHFLSIRERRPTAPLLRKHFCSSWFVTGSPQTRERCFFFQKVYIPTVHHFRLNIPQSHRIFELESLGTL